MRLITRAHERRLFSILLILSIVSFAVPHASQDDASDEFILFVSDRAFPSQLGICSPLRRHLRDAACRGITRRAKRDPPHGRWRCR